MVSLSQTINESLLSNVLLKKQTVFNLSQNNYIRSLSYYHIQLFNNFQAIISQKTDFFFDRIKTIIKESITISYDFICEYSFQQNTQTELNQYFLVKKSRFFYLTKRNPGV